jgi:hypothetical protein
VLRRRVGVGGAADGGGLGRGQFAAAQRFGDGGELSEAVGRVQHDLCGGSGRAGVAGE